MARESKAERARECGWLRAVLVMALRQAIVPALLLSVVWMVYGTFLANWSSKMVYPKLLKYHDLGGPAASRNHPGKVSARLLPP